MGNPQCAKWALWIVWILHVKQWQKSEQGDRYYPKSWPEHISTVLIWLYFNNSISFAYCFPFFPIIMLLLKVVLICAHVWGLSMNGKVYYNVTCSFIWKPYLFVCWFSSIKPSCFLIYIHCLLMFPLANLLYSFYIVFCNFVV